MNAMDDPAVPSEPQAGAVGDQQWIAVTERLPKPHQSVALVNVHRFENCDFDRNVHAVGYLATWGGLPGHWSIIGERASTIEAFTHWLPLPDPPQERLLPEW